MQYSLMVHGGAGKVAQLDAYKAGMTKAIEIGQSILASGGTALDAVVAAVTVLEDDPSFNAGRGSVLDEGGRVEMDASVMEGDRLRAGAVAGIREIKNPVSLARAVMEKTQHVMLIGEGAMQFARLAGVETAPPEYFITDARRLQLAEAQKSGTVVLDHDSLIEQKFGTVGAVARDVQGNLAAATSTGGIVNKKFGRVGDTPLIGAGTYADNRTCAVSATGFGEQFIRTVFAKTIADFIVRDGISAQEAADKGVAYLVERVNGLGGAIVIDAHGRLGVAFSTPGLAHAFVAPDGSIVCRFA